MTLNKRTRSLRKFARLYRCRCKKPVFFRNSQCMSCGAELGYVPEIGELLPFNAGSKPGTWRIERRGTGPGEFQRCANADSAAGCNWLLPVHESTITTLCRCCRLNRTIPDLSIPENGIFWAKVEMAKRRLVSSLISLGLPVVSRVSEDPARGLAFDLLRTPPEGPPVFTGHASGVITINIEEADDSVRERIRQELRERYRTLLGHLRHESGHYYWDRLIAHSERLDPFRRLFGDERENYPEALQRYYQIGPNPAWMNRFVSAYASAHPWEDWAETWAHYLHFTDTLHAARSFGLDPSAEHITFDPFTADALPEPAHPGAAAFLEIINAWTPLTIVLNEMARSMGLADSYPFVLSRTAVGKLYFVHSTIHAAGNIWLD